MKNTIVLQIVLITAISLNVSGCSEKQSYTKFAPMDFRIDSSLVSSSETFFEDFSIQLPYNFQQLESNLIQEIKSRIEDQKDTHVIDPKVVDIYTDSLNNSLILSSLNEDNLLSKLENEFLMQIRQRYQESFNISYFTINGIPVVYFQIYNDEFVNLKIFLLENTGFQLDFMIKKNQYREYSKLIESSIGTIKRNNTKENN